MVWRNAFIIGEDFIGDDHVALILGDNIFHGNGLTKMLQRAEAKEKGATVFGYQVKDPERFGVVEFDADMNAISSRKTRTSKIELCSDRTLLL